MFKIILILCALLPLTLSSFPGEGKGTEKEPYLITNIIQLQGIGPEFSSSTYFKLTNDIDASETRYWNIGDHDRDTLTPDEPMGFRPLSPSGQGNLDGNGYKIFNLYINRPKDWSGLFSSMGGYLGKLGLVDCDITGGGSYTGSICSELIVNGLIEECYATGKVTISGKWDCSGAGFCGYNAEGKIKNCYSEVKVFALNQEYDYNIGSFKSGFGGYTGKCYTTGEVISNKKVTAFGIKGADNCYWDIETTEIPSVDSTLIKKGYYQCCGHSTQQMKTQNNFSAWDFDKVWYIDEGKDYPKLRAFRKDTTGINDVTNSNSFEITPNPAIDFIEINVGVNDGLYGVIGIYDVFGRKLTTLSSPFNSPASGGQLRIDVSGLVPGVYFCTLSSNGYVDTRQFVVIK